MFAEHLLAARCCLGSGRKWHTKVNCLLVSWNGTQGQEWSLRGGVTQHKSHKLYFGCWKHSHGIVWTRSRTQVTSLMKWR